MINLIQTYKDSGEFLWIMIGAYLIAIIIALCSHEYAHARTAYNCGDDTAKVSGRMTLNPLAHISPIGALCFLLVGFGWANPVPINPNKFKNYRKGIFLTSIAGVLTNFTICFFSCGFYSLFSYLYILVMSSSGLNTGFYVLYFFAQVFQYSAIINFSLCIFNLLPLYPLDGYNVLKSVTKGTNKFVDFLGRYSTIILLVLMLSTVFETGMGYAVDFVLQPILLFWSKIIFGVV